MRPLGFFIMLPGMDSFREITQYRCNSRALGIIPRVLPSCFFKARLPDFTAAVRSGTRVKQFSSDFTDHPKVILLIIRLE